MVVVCGMTDSSIVIVTTNANVTAVEIIHSPFRFVIGTYNSFEMLHCDCFENQLTFPQEPFVLQEGRRVHVWRCTLLKE